MAASITSAKVDAEVDANGDQQWNMLAAVTEPILLLSSSGSNSGSGSGFGAADQNNSSSAGEITDDYEYDYDFNSSFNNYDWAELVPAVVVYSFVLLLGISGNGLIIFTIARYRRLKTITNIFLASLASADLLLVIICVPVNVAKLFSYTWTFGVFLCKFVHYMQNVSAICSVLTLTAMSIERYYAIVHPMRAQYLCTLSQARKVIVATWVASFALAMPTLWIQIHLAVGVRVPAFWCVRDWDNPLSWQIYELYMLVLVLVLPLSIMGCAYASIGREIWRVTYLRSTMANDPNTEASPAASAPVVATATAVIVTDAPASDLPDVVGPEACQTLNANADDIKSSRKESLKPSPSSRRKSNSGATANSVNKGSSNRRRGSTNCRPPPSSQRAQADHRTARQVVKMLVAVVVLFAVCWSPYLIDNVLMSFELLPGARTGPMKHMRIAFHLLSYINSCCNPLVYGFMSRNFRRGFKAALRLRSKTCVPYFCYCASCCCRHPRNVRQRSVYKFSQVSRNSRLTTQIRLQDPGYVRSSVVGVSHSSVEAGSVM